MKKYGLLWVLAVSLGLSGAARADIYIRKNNPAPPRVIEPAAPVVTPSVPDKKVKAAIAPPVPQYQNTAPPPLPARICTAQELAALHDALVGYYRAQNSRLAHPDAAAEFEETAGDPVLAKVDAVQPLLIKCAPEIDFAAIHSAAARN